MRYKQEPRSTPKSGEAAGTFSHLARALGQLLLAGFAARAEAVLAPAPLGRDR